MVTKTPEEMAEKYLEQDKVACDAINHAAEHLVKDAFLAGYQAAKDTYKDAISTYEEVAKQMMEEAVRIMSPKNEVADASKVMNSPEKLDSWISVKERLPEINKGFIGFAENKEVCNCYRYPDHSEDGRPVFYAQTKTGLLICGLESISHWMPLPKPPEDK